MICTYFASNILIAIFRTFKTTFASKRNNLLSRYCLATSAVIRHTFCSLCFPYVLLPLIRISFPFPSNYLHTSILVDGLDSVGLRRSLLCDVVDGLDGVGLRRSLLWKYSNIVFMNSVMSLRIIIAYLLMALKKVTELLPLWSIETTLSVFDYLMQQAVSELNYMPFCLR